MPVVSVNIHISRTLEEMGAFKEGPLLPSLVSQSIKMTENLSQGEADALFKGIDEAVSAQFSEYWSGESKTNR